MYCAHISQSVAKNCLGGLHEKGSSSFEINQFYVYLYITNLDIY